MKKVLIKTFQFVSVFLATYAMVFIYGIVISFITKMVFGVPTSFLAICFISSMIAFGGGLNIVLGDYIPKTKFLAK